MRSKDIKLTAGLANMGDLMVQPSWSLPSLAPKLKGGKMHRIQNIVSIQANPAWLDLLGRKLPSGTAPSGDGSRFVASTELLLSAFLDF